MRLRAYAGQRVQHPNLSHIFSADLRANLPCPPRIVIPGFSSLKPPMFLVRRHVIF